MHRRFFSVLFSAALPLAAGAQEGTAEETTPQANDAANAGVEATTSNVSAETGNGSSSSRTGSQPQTDEGTQSQAVTGDLNTAQRSGIPNGTPAPGTNPDNPSSPPDLITIGVEDCTVSDGASITVEDGDGTETRFVDGSRAIEIIGTRDDVTIEGPPGDFIGDHAVSTSDPGFDTDGDYTVVTSSGITCKNEGGGGGYNNDNAVHKQYVKTVEERVIKETIPNKGRLANTGGMPLVGVVFLSFAMVGLGISILRSAIRPER